MNAALATSDRAEANRWAEAVQTAGTAATDPWWTYWQADYRFYPSLLAYLREAVK